MKTAIALIGLAALFTGSALAKGVITLINETNGTIVARTYDWDDSVRLEFADSAWIEPGETGYVTCKKSWLDEDAPGCYLLLQTDDYHYTIVNKKKYKSATYFVRGAWKSEGEKVTVTQELRVEPVEGSSEVTIPKLQLPTSGGGTAQCIFKGTAVNLAWNEYMSFRWQSDGNLVVRDPHGFQWTSGTGSDATKLCFQGDGNLVIYRNSHDPWATGTSPNGATLRLQKDCNVVVKDAGGSTLWQTHTHCRY